MRTAARTFPLIMLVLAAACSSSTDSGSGVVLLKAEPAVLNLGVPATGQIAVSITDNLGAVLIRPLTFTSSDTAVVKVNATGLVTAIGSGTATISVATSGATTVTVPVIANNNTVILTADTTLLTGTLTAHIAAVVRSGGTVVSAPVILTVRDTSVLALSAAGVVTRKLVGSSWIVAASGGGRDSVQITALIARVPIAATPFAVGLLSASAAYVVGISSSVAYRVNLTTKAVTPVAAVGPTASSLAVTSNGALAFVGNQGSGTVSVINTATNTTTNTVTLAGSVLAVAVAPGDSMLAVGTDIGKLYLVRIATLAKTDSFPVPSYTNAIAFRGDTTLFANVVDGHAVVEINLRTRAVVRTIPIPGAPQALLVSSNGTQLYVANEIGQFQAWNLVTGLLGSFITLPGGGGFSMARNPANGLIYVGSSYIGARIHVIDPATQTIVRTIVTGGTVRRIQFTADGSIGLAANETGWVDFIN